MMDMMNYGHGGWMMGGMWLLWILFWILIIAGAALIVRWLTGRSSEGKTSAAESPLDILKKRYARGEINSATFEKMKRDIEDQ